MGLHIYKDGSRYQGNWTEGVKHGQGVYFLANNETLFEGSFRNDHMEGEGQITFNDGLIIKGRWYAGKLKERKSTRQQTYYQREQHLKMLEGFKEWNQL